MTQKARLLIVDDEPKNIHLLSNVFADDYDISAAISGAQALRLLEHNNDIELILLDVMMPEMDGHALFAKLRANPATADIPVVFVTDRADPDSEILSLKAGAVDYIHKPIHVGIARIRVEQQLALSRQKKSLQQLLRERTLEQHRLSNIIEGTASGTWEWEVASDRLFINQHFASMLGISPQELKTYTMAQWTARVHKDDQALCAQALRAWVRQGNTLHSETLRLQHAQGHWVWVQIRGSRMDDTTSQAVRVFGTQADMSALVQAKVADAANRAKSEFLSRMSHELRTPLNAILGFGKLMSLDEGLTASQLDYLNEILQAGRHLLGLVNEVLDLHQIEAGRMTVEVKDLLLAPLAQDNVDLLEPLALAAGVSLHMNIAPDTVVRADPKRLSQVLINLVSNAVKYNREGGFVRLESAHLADGRVQITVVDNGLGISDTAQAMIFQPFERGDADDTPVQGTGLGLTLTRKLVDLMDGEIGFESQDGQGSRFWVVLNAGKL